MIGIVLYYSQCGTLDGVLCLAPSLLSPAHLLKYPYILCYASVSISSAFCLFVFHTKSIKIHFIFPLITIKLCMLVLLIPQPLYYPSLVQPTKELLEKHYADLSKKPFFPGLITFMSSGPVVAMVSTEGSVPVGGHIVYSCGGLLGYAMVPLSQVWEGKGVVKTGRVMLGETNPVS